jgi:hypothetical protein
MNRAADRRRLRRDYLRRKYGSLAERTICGLVFVASLFISVVLVVIGIWILVDGMNHALRSGRLALDGGAVIVFTLICLVPAKVVGLVAWFSWKGMRHAHRRATALSYVPPVTASARSPTKSYSEVPRNRPSRKARCC